MHRFAKPRAFLRLSARLMPWIGGLTAIALGAGLYLGLLASPQDYQQGHTVRIMYIHVPAAWMGLFGYVTIALCSAMALIWRHPLADVAARACAPAGAAFTLICLITGSLWGKPMWGTWWVWDARLTSMLILLFLYLGYMALTNAFDDPARGARAAAWLALVGVINVPIVKFSVDWWNTLHQPASVLRLDGPSIHPDMLWPLFLMAAAAKGCFVLILIYRIRADLIGRRLRVMRMTARI